MKEICRIAISFKADYRQFPKTWIFGYRWNKGKKSAEKSNRRQKNSVGGRTSAVVPEVQKIEKSVAKVSPAKKTTVTVAKKAVKAKVSSKEKRLNPHSLPDPTHSTRYFYSPELENHCKKS
ncbi:hypothetical protein DSO57_1009719 [Entomophthora muscae]|uniref:Uncharacterized protein n=1 Tax=Entomophthora muscae TaxID=34485 RepID=A0ACC2UG44_9FUNG|nr:hypothetical protein DSO57_1009719 [Entomophthora muscae]